MEQWKSIPGYEGLYEASNLGRIRTAEGKVTSNARYPHRVWKQRIMKQKYEARKSGPYKDARVSLWKDGKVKDFLVSRLVAMTFVDGYQDGMTVNHIDGNPLNNYADNLEWVTRKKNIQDAFKNGQYRNRQKAYEFNGILYRSQSEASVAMGHTVGYVSNCKLRGRVPKPSPEVV